ncbi:MAG: hypothetical protein PHN60_02310 [Candidatus Gracilibacteria bacterium]|nr:hypothetical protein [Candidatus Gracilibacteria bacterium]
MSGEKSTPLECTIEQKERRVIVEGAMTVYGAMKRLGIENGTLAEYLQTELARESLLEGDGKGGFRIPEGYIFILDNKGSLRLERKGKIGGKEEIIIITSAQKNGSLHMLRYDLNGIIKEHLQPQERTRTKNRLDALRNEIEFERAILDGDREKVRAILKNTPNDVKHLKFINIIRQITGKESICSRGKFLNGFGIIRQIFTRNIGSNVVQIDFLGDTGMAHDLVTYDLFGDIELLRDKEGDYRLGGFNHDSMERDVVGYFTSSGNKMDIEEGEIIMMSDDGKFPQEFPEKKVESVQMGSVKTQIIQETNISKKTQKKREEEKEKEQLPVEKKKTIKKPEKKEKKISVMEKSEVSSKISDKKSKTHTQEHIEQLKNKTLKEKEKVFLEEFNPFIDAISKTYGLPKNHFLSLIERESSFDPSTDDNPRSFGFNQLTGVAFDDMKYGYKIQERNKKTKKLETKTVEQGGRGYLYVDLFLKTINKNPDLLNQSLIEKIPDETTQKRLKKIGEYAKKGINTIEDKGQYNKAVRELYRLAHTDDYVNILIGAISYEGLRKEGKSVKSGNTKDVFGVNRAVSYDLKKIKDSTLVKFVLQGTESTKERIKEILMYKKQIIGNLQKKDEKTYLDFYSLYRYNGDTNLEIGESLPQKLYFAMSIMIKERLRNRV